MFVELSECHVSESGDGDLVISAMDTSPAKKAVEPQQQSLVGANDLPYNTFIVKPTYMYTDLCALVREVF